MNWNNWADFVAMGGYGLYVWGSFGVVAFALLLEVWLLALRKARLRMPGGLPGADRGWPHETQA
jgi:heme exporter protein D